MFMNIVQKSIDEIFPYQKNPRKNNKAVDIVANSLEQYGFQQPIVVDNDNIIIVGHTRYQAAKKLQMKTIPVLVAQDLTAEKAKAYRIMDNKSSEYAKWNDSLLFEELTDLIQDNNINIVSEQTGISEAELNRLFAEPLPIQDVVSEDTPTQSKQGDIFILGDHKIACGSSLDNNIIQSLLQDDLIDCIWTDPPYGIAWQGAQGQGYEQRDWSIANDDMDAQSTSQMIQQHIQAIDANVKAGASIYMCHDIKFTSQWRSLLEQNNYNINSCLIWDKKGYSEASKFLRYRKGYEPILYGWKKGMESQWYGERHTDLYQPEMLSQYTNSQLIDIIKKLETPSDVNEFKREKREVMKLHPTVKPTGLIIYHLRNSTKKGDTVFDGFAGSGAVIQACEKSGRQARCIELEARYVDISIKRWQELTGLTAVRQRDNKPFTEITAI